jgi:Cytochrome oxidase complex assembly protein 1
MVLREAKVLFGFLHGGLLFMADPIAPWLMPTQNKSWLARKRKLLVGLLVAFLVVAVALAFGVVWIFISSTRESAVAREAMAKARSNPTVVQQLGTPINEAWVVSSSLHLSTSGSGDAEFHLPISGPKGKGTVHVTAHESDGVWSYSLMQVEIDGRAEKIDLLPVSSPAQAGAGATPESTSAAHTYSYSGHIPVFWLVVLFLVFLAYRKWRRSRSPVKTPGDAVRSPIGNAATYSREIPPTHSPERPPMMTPPPPVLGASGIFGIVFPSLVGLVFAGVGLFMLARAFGLTRSPGHDRMDIYVGIFSSLVGLGVIFRGIYVGGGALRLKMRQAKYPTEPWLWRKDWARGRANSKIWTKLLTGWALAGFLNGMLLFAFPSLINLQEEVHKSGASAYLILAVPILGAISLIYAVLKTIAFLKFGNTYFEMSSVPGVVGGELQGVVHSRLSHLPERGIHLQLSCVDRYHGGEHSSSHLLWRDETDLSAAQLYSGPVGTSIPVAFRIPLDAKPTGRLSTAREILWQLEILADVPGVKYRDIFEIPVFRTQQNLAQTQAEPFVSSEKPVTVAVEQPSPTTSISGARGLAELLKDARETGRIGELTGTFGPPETGQPIARPESLSFQVRENATGTEFYFPAKRNLRSAIFLTGGLLFCCAFTVFAILEHLPIFIQWFVGIFSLIWIYGTIQTWVGNTRLVIGDGSLTLRSSLLGSGKVRQIPLSEIVSIRGGIGATDQMGDTLTPTYFIELSQRNGKKLGLAQSRDRHEAEWMVQEMCRLAGLLPKR